jgi:predicted Zn-dependent protease
MHGISSRSLAGASLRCAAALLVGLSLLGCGTLSVPEEQALGRQMNAEIRRGLVFLPDRVVEKYVRDIGEDILRAAGPQPFEYHFYVVEDDAINAFAAPAGHVYIHTQTILAASNVSELAGVIAHEIGHVVRRHIAENYNRQRNTGIGYQAAVLAAGILGGGAAATAAQLGGGLAAVAYINSFGREAEREADSFAVETMPRAGYDPDGLVTFFQTLQQESGDTPSDFLSSHPATAERAAAAREQIAALPATQGLKVHDNGRLEIIQRRIEILMGDRASTHPKRYK